MPCIYGVHYGRQVFADVSIVHPRDQAQYSTGSSNAYLKSVQTFRALIDTGATRTMISPNVVRKMGLVPIGKMAFLNITGQEWHNAYLFYVGFSGELVPPQNVDIPDRPAGRWSRVHVYPAVIKGGELPSNRRFDVLLGMDVISTGRLEIDRTGHFSFTFGFPDGVEENEEPSGKAG